jgi:hypothetical protein
MFSNNIEMSVVIEGFKKKNIKQSIVSNPQCDCKKCNKPSTVKKSTTSQQQQQQIPCKHDLTDTERDYYFIQYPDVLNNYCGGNKKNRKCAAKHWTQHGCKEGRNYELPDSCKHILTDQEAICYIQENNLNYKLVGNDLNKARAHWKTNGCINGLNYTCRPDSEMDILKKQLTIVKNQQTDLAEDYKEYVDTADEKVANILKMEVTSLPFVLNSVKQQNKKLETELETKTSNQLTHNQGAFYAETQNESLLVFNTLLFWTYYVICFVLAGVLFIYKQNLPFYNKLYWIAFFVIFPYLVYPLEYGAWFVFHYITSFVYSKVFIW